MKYNVLADYIQSLIKPLRNHYSRGLYTLRISPNPTLDDDGMQRYWRVHKKFPNDFAGAINRMLPKDVDFISYDHLANKLTLFKK